MGFAFSLHLLFRARHRDGFFRRALESRPRQRTSRRMGAGRPPVRHLDHLVPGRRRFLHRLHRDRGAGAGLCGRRLRLLRAALHHHRLSLRVRGDAGAVEGGARQWPRHRGRRRAWHLQFARARACGGDHRHGRDHALYRAAIDRHGRGDQGDGPDRRTADRRRLRHPRALHLQLGPAGARADRLRQGHHDLHRGAGGGGGGADEAWRLRRGVFRRQRRLHRQGRRHRPHS